MAQGCLITHTKNHLIKHLYFFNFIQEHTSKTESISIETDLIRH